MPEVGQIWRELQDENTKCYIIFINYKDEATKQHIACVHALYENGYVHKWTLNGFTRNNEFTGDKVPLEDIMAVIFP